MLMKASNYALKITDEVGFAMFYCPKLQTTLAEQHN